MTDPRPNNDVSEDDDRGEHNKTVFAHYGVAMYLAQCLEHALVNAMLFLNQFPNRANTARTRQEWWDCVDGFYDHHFEHTLGRMIRDLAKVTAVPGELESKLSRALALRNWLAHDFFRERADGFATTERHDRMIAELEDVQAVFRDVDALLERTFKPAREKYGFTDERLDQIFKQMIAEDAGQEPDWKPMPGA